MDYEVQKIFKWFNQFNKEDIKLKSESKEFYIEIRNLALPHLLGLQYMNYKYEKKKAYMIYNYIKNNNLSDEKIFKEIKQKNPNMLNSVKKRVSTLRYFLENLENAYVVEKSNANSDIESNYLIIQTKDNFILHLGLKQDEIEDRIESFTVFEKDTYLETYFSRKDDKYYNETPIVEKIKGIYRYNEEIGIYEKFSFSGHSLDKINENNNDIFKQIYKNKENDFER